MINYYMPGFVESQPAYAHLFYLRDKAPQCFYDNVCIKKIYGAFPNMIWNGGSYWFGPVMTPDVVRQYFEWYKDKGVILQLVCTNPVLTETDVYDRYCNMILEIASQYPFTEVLVSSPYLEKYIQEKYPHMPIDKSIIATTRDRDTETDSLEHYIADVEKYNMCVLPRKYTRNVDFLKQIPEHLRDRFEVLVTDPCPITCPRLYSHYEDMARVQLYEQVEKSTAFCTGINPDNPFRKWTYRHMRVQYDELTKVYEPLGFTEIKLSGRTSMVQMAVTTVPYLIKPEYREDVYMDLLNSFSHEIPEPRFV